MHLHSLTDSRIPLVADTSVIINLVASGYAEEIISGLSNPVFVVDEIVGELNQGKLSGCKDVDVLLELIQKNVIKRVSLDDEGWEHFGDLVSGSSRTSLDDGEAATLAYCVVNNLVPVIDEKKANQVCQKRYKKLRPISSAALFKLASQGDIVEPSSLSDALFRALTIGRMFVMQHHLDWVVNMVGSDRAVKCNSISKRSRRLINSSNRHR